MGERINEPARGFLFVPGGRIYKNESLEKAFERICFEEIGIILKHSDSKLLGIYEHFFDNSLWENSEINSHYIILAYVINITNYSKINLSKQHKSFNWISKLDTMNSSMHRYSLQYLNDIKYIN